jgi:hypothetical protein
MTSFVADHACLKPETLNKKAKTILRLFSLEHIPPGFWRFAHEHWANASGAISEFRDMLLLPESVFTTFFRVKALMEFLLQNHTVV